MYALLACTPSEPPQADHRRPSLSNNPSPAVDVGYTARRPRLEGQVWECPAGMVPVGEDLAFPDFCIDPYEVTVTGEVGDHNQHSGSGAPTMATSTSVAGVIPAVTMSFGQALAICKNTAALDADQQPVGNKWLARSQEWEDAADGVPGGGGQLYPYGDDWQDDTCATPLRDGKAVLHGLQATGSRKGCVSRFGVYDAVGNAWEWSDSGQVYDIKAWMAAARSRGVPISLGPANTIRVKASALDNIHLEMASISGSSSMLHIGDNGALQLDPTLFGPTVNSPFFTGHLVLFVDGVELGLAPVLLQTEEGVTAPQPLTMLWDDDGAPIPHKRGCAYYTGSAYGCLITQTNRGHRHDFHGTISFRCAADPILQ